MPTEPQDSFDRAVFDGPRRGVHRGPKPRGRGWVTFAWAALATGVLVGLGVVGLFAINNKINFVGTSGGDSSAVASDAVTPTPTVEPTTNAAAKVTILNGTTVAGLATRAGTQATTAGWAVGAEANASTTDITASTVYYADAGNEGAAKGLAAALGGIAVQQSTQFQGADLTAVLGTDYKDPGK
ncbi:MULTISPECIES: LytR C-terminal domain-containing protein [Subtercola]|uniref:LytR family transcriptional regulator n=1 Tax=Subtercola vilae TaxID=2056433 RepID=A0A4T2BP32_9MICO|nr:MULTISPECIES: LytR C-terminal domain-containing protein [Subtercola]MEA9987045.1 LytR C-terminal domain-containing protein [Subtercola sp. RTI3]TIH32709.1 LytR family transcriptional regulator [Subtercola vilae]